MARTVAKTVNNGQSIFIHDADFENSVFYVNICELYFSCCI